MEMRNNENVQPQENEELFQGIPKRFIYFFDNQPFIKYDGLVNLADGRGIKSLKTELIQIPNKENGMIAIIKADLIGSNNSEYSDYGDASPNSVAEKIAPHIIRMASTRAKARVLRDYLAIGITCFEELDFYKAEGNPENEIPYDEREGTITKNQKDTIVRNLKFLDVAISEEQISKLSKSEANKLIKSITAKWKASEKSGKEQSKEIKKSKEENNNEDNANTVVKNDTTEPTSESKNVDSNVDQPVVSEKKEGINKETNTSLNDAIAQTLSKIGDNSIDNEFCSDAKENYLHILAKKYSESTGKEIDVVIKRIGEKFKIKINPSDKTKFKVLSNDVYSVRDCIIQETLFL